MDEIDARCKEYKRLGCHFAKWRMWIKIRAATGAPSDLAINEGARSLAMYALICQANGIVPIVEPDIDRSGMLILKEFCFGSPCMLTFGSSPKSVICAGFFEAGPREKFVQSSSFYT